jgi:effector-binding domain-containing protein
MQGEMGGWKGLEFREVMGPAIAEVVSTLADQGAAPVGPCFSHYFRRPTETLDFEVGFPVGAPIAPAGRVKMSTLPAAKVARTVYRGDYEGLGAAWGDFCAWIEAAGSSVQDRFRETCTSGPESSSDPSQWCTELTRPLS